MRSKRRMMIGAIGLVMAVGATLLTGTFASAAPEKVYDLNIAPASVQAGQTGVQLKATFRNATPSGNSSFNSLSLTAPSGFTITAASGIANEVVAPGGGSVSATNIPPVKPGAKYELNLTVTAPAATDCTSTASWAGPQGQGVAVWTGSSLSGETFRFLPLGSSVTTTITAASECVLRFVSGRSPADALKNTTITSASLTPSGPPVQVELADPDTNVVASWFTGMVALDKTADSTGLGAVTGNTATAVAGIATFNGISLNDLKIDKAGGYKLQASSGSLVSAPSAQFTISDGVLGCTAGNNVATERGVTITRLANADGSACVLIPYILTRDGNSVSFLKDLLTQTAAQFRVEVNSWDPEPAQNPVPPTKVDTPTPTHNLQWCNGTVASPLLPGSEVTCLITQSTTIVGGGQMQVSETYYLKGDIRWQR
jgi:hypothetical protein